MVVEGLTCKTPSGETLRVREVWQENLEEEFDLIRDIVDEYPFVARDPEFPGVGARPVGKFKNSGEYHFQTLRCVQLRKESCLTACDCSQLRDRCLQYYLDVATQPRSSQPFLFDKHGLVRTGAM